MTISQKTAIVTGAGRGIGRAICKTFADGGIHVIASARSEEQLVTLVEEISSNGGTAEYFVCDLSRRERVFELIDAVRQKEINILVNNAGVGSSQNPKPLVEFEDDFWHLTMAVNLHAPYYLTKHLLPPMIAQGFGRIINISSINAKVPALHGAAYTASKHAIAGLTKSTASEIAGCGVTANAICPGVTATAMNDLRIEYDARRLGDRFEEVEKKSTPYGRRLTADEIAPLAKFLASDDSAAINGQLLNACGGTVMAC